MQPSTLLEIFFSWKVACCKLSELTWNMIAVCNVDLDDLHTHVFGGCGCLACVTDCVACGES